MTVDHVILTDKLRREDPDQFNTLVRMHLSFNLDLNSEECDSGTDRKTKVMKWNLFNKKTKSPGVKCITDVTLSTQTVQQVYQLIKFLKQENNITQEGVFRRSGKLTRQQELKSLLHKGVNLDLCDGQFSVHDCASVLKNFLSELPESVLTEAHYPAYCQIAENLHNKNDVNEKRLLETLQLLFLLLPIDNRNFVQDIIQLLHLAASYQDKNKMSADNLATLFTPHLLCPKKLSPEAFHSNSQIMSKVVAFMITKGSELFDIPSSLGQDVKAYWDKKEKRKLSPLKQLNESVCDGTAASTIFTFVDRQKSAQPNGVNPTETALAELYAHIQSLPESSKKRKLIKQFNKENGCGTPLHKKYVRRGNLGDSIKKHLPGFNKGNRLNQLQQQASDDKCKENAAQPTGTSTDKISLKSSKSCEHLEEAAGTNNLYMYASKSCETLDKIEQHEGKKDVSGGEERKGTKRTSPNNMEHHLFTKTPRLLDEHRINFNETMMTPRSRKPVVSLSGTELCELGVSTTDDTSATATTSESSNNDSLSSVFRDYLYSRSILTASPVDLSFTSMTDDYGSTREDSTNSANNINQIHMTDSLLYCLDGNDPADNDWLQSDTHVHETAL